jgi:hypothetical protein
VDLHCEKYLNVVSAATVEAEIEGGVRMVVSVFGQQSRATDPTFAPAKEALIKAYSTGLLAATQGSKGRTISAGTSTAFEGLTRWITHDEFALLMTEITRILMRTPEYLLDSICITLTQLTIRPYTKTARTCCIDHRMLCQHYIQCVVEKVNFPRTNGLLTVTHVNST